MSARWPDWDGWQWPVVVSVLFSAVFIARASFVEDGHRAFSLFDDAMISMTYARNLAAGAGLRWNVGQPPVEGFTNPLWVLWMTVPALLHIDELHAALAVSVSGAVILALLVWTTWSLGVSVGGSRAAGAVAAWAVACCYPLAYWTLRGMEVGLLALVLHVAMLLAFRYEEAPRSSTVAMLAALLAIAPLVRLDAVVAVGMILAYCSSWWRAPERRGALIVCAAAPLAAVGAQTALRVWYFHAWLPNTYYLKIDGSSAAQRWTRGAHTFVIHTIRELAAPLGLAALSPSLLTRRGALLAAIVIGQLGYAVSVGGDSWDWMDYANRFVSVALPSLLILAGTALASRARAVTPTRDALITAAIAVGVAGAVFPASVRDGFRDVFRSTFSELEFVVRTGVFLCAAVWAWRAAASVVPERGGSRSARSVLAPTGLVMRTTWLVVALSSIPMAGWWFRGAVLVDDDTLMTRVGLAIRHHTPPETTIAVAWAGAIVFHAHRPSIDLLGKSDAVIARSPRHGFAPGHDKWDYEYSIHQKQPDLIVQLPSPSEPELLALRGWGFERLTVTPANPWFDLYVHRGRPAIDRAGLQAELGLAFSRVQ